MKNLSFTLLLVIFSACLYSQKNPNYSEFEVIVKFKPDTDIDLKSFNTVRHFDNQILDKYHTTHLLESVSLTGNKKNKNSYVLKYLTPQNIEEIVKMYLDTGLFEYVEPNYKSTGAGKRSMIQTIPDDDFFSRQYGLLNDGSFSLSDAVPDADVDMDLAWDIEQGDPDIILAVLDSGAKLDHPEFNGRHLANKCRIYKRTR